MLTSNNLTVLVSQKPTEGVCMMWEGKSLLYLRKELQVGHVAHPLRTDGLSENFPFLQWEPLSRLRENVSPVLQKGVNSLTGIDFSSLLLWLNLVYSLKARVAVVMKLLTRTFFM